MLKFVKFFRPVIPLVLNDHLLMLEMILSPSVHQIEDGIQVLTHLSISCLKGFNAVFVHF